MAGRGGETVDDIESEFWAEVARGVPWTGAQGQCRVDSHTLPAPPSVSAPLRLVLRAKRGHRVLVMNVVCLCTCGCVLPMGTPCLWVCSGPAALRLLLPAMRRRSARGGRHAMFARCMGFA